jgi:AraC-like DNA-binding protein
MAGLDEHWIARPPAPTLAPFVEGYVGYRMCGFLPAVHRGLPSRHPTFIVGIGPVIDVVAQTDPAQAPARYGCVLSGLQASTALIAHDGNQEGVAIELTPVGFRALFGMPIRALWNTSVELADVAGPAGRELWERLQAPAATWSERFAVCDEVLGRLVAEPVVAPELRRAWHLLVASGGTCASGDLAYEVGWTRQHLARRFRDEFGLGPKLAGRVIRFERARRLLEAPSGPSLAGVAASCGYYDQAHLARDVADLAGCTPSQLAAGDVPSVQDAAAPAG